LKGEIILHFLNKDHLLPFQLRRLFITFAAWNNWLRR
jgi:hypothetical protein